MWSQLREPQPMGPQPMGCQPEVCKGGSAENPPVFKNLAKSPYPDPPSRRAKLDENFLGFFREFSGKFRVFQGNFA